MIKSYQSEFLIRQKNIKLIQEYAPIPIASWHIAKRNKHKKRQDIFIKARDYTAKLGKKKTGEEGGTVREPKLQDRNERGSTFVEFALSN